jgi:hypothetical protein
MIHLRLLRRRFTDNSTIGDLYLNGKFFCFTLEDTTRAPGIKIDGQTAIPFGTREIEVTYSPTFKTDLPLIKNVPGFEGVRIHAGNGPEHSRGCILVGYSRQGKDRIGDSREAFKDLMAELAKAGNKAIIEITPTITIM